MNIKIEKQVLLITLISFLTFSGCNKKSDTGPGGGQRVVKYEITGNFTGKLLIIYNDNVNGNTVLTDVSLPWTKEITYPNSVSGIGISGQSSTNGLAGQTATVKIYSGGTVVQNQPAIPVGSGALALPNLTYLFQ